MAMGVEDPRRDFDELPGVSHQHDLPESQTYGFFNHVADKVAHSDHDLRVDTHLLAHKTLAVVSRHQYDTLQPSRPLNFQLQRQRTFPALFRHRRDNTRGADNRNATQNAKAGVVGFLRPFFAFWREDFNLRPTIWANRFADG